MIKINLSKIKKAPLVKGAFQENKLADLFD